MSQIYIIVVVTRRLLDSVWDQSSPLTERGNNMIGPRIKKIYIMHYVL